MPEQDDLHAQLDNIMQRLSELEDRSPGEKSGQVIVDLGRLGLDQDQQAQVRDAISAAARERLQSIGAEPAMRGDDEGTYSYSR